MREESPEGFRRLAELESRLAFQDDLIESLNKVVARQDRQLARIEERVQALARRVAEIGDSAAASGHEVPPHY